MIILKYFTVRISITYSKRSKLISKDINVRTEMKLIILINYIHGLIRFNYNFIYFRFWIF